MIQLVSASNDAVRVWGLADEALVKSAIDHSKRRRINRVFLLAAIVAVTSLVLSILQKLRVR